MAEQTPIPTAPSPLAGKRVVITRAEAQSAGLTTAAASVIEMGACAARQLISQINGLRISGITTLSVRLVVRATCGFKAQDT